MTEEEGFKTLFQEEREKRRTPRVSGMDKKWWDRERGYQFSCPYVDDFTCRWSRKFRSTPFVCSGSWHLTCEIYIKIKNNNEDPSVLII